MRRLLLWLPLLAVVGLLVVIASGLYRPAERVVRSKMVGQSIPSFVLPPLVPDKAGLSSADLASGEPRLLNIFASWCAPCIAEAPVLLKLKAAGVGIDGIAVRDTASDMATFLERHGDAYDRIGSDVESQVQLSLGSSGVPESFVVDGHGKIVLQHVGDIKAEDVPEIIAAVRAAR